MPRYAMYFAPDPASALWQFGSAVLGRDSASGSDVPQWDGSGLAAAEWHELTAEPRRYGFHATLKAPFELADGCDEARLLAEAGELACRHASVELDALDVREIGRFIALVPRSPSPDLQALAGNIVTGFEHLRRPLAAADRERRLRSPLSERQIELLDRYGYPYVLEQFRFHMTLTGPIADAAERARIAAALASAFAMACPSEPIALDALAVLRQDHRHEHFHIIARLPLTGLPS